MLYLYTIMMGAWDLDPDTHAYFREYLDVFINKRKISKDLRKYLTKDQRVLGPHIRQGQGQEQKKEKDKFMASRTSLPRRVCIAQRPWSYEYIGRKPPNLIEKIHPPKYHHDARKLSAPSRPHTNP